MQEDGPKDIGQLYRGQVSLANTWRSRLDRTAHGIGFLEAVGRRFKRVYAWILLVLYMAWLAKIWIHPEAASSFGTVVSRASVGFLPGLVIFSFVTGTLIGMGLLSVYFTRRREAKGGIRAEREKAEGWKD